MELKSEQKLLKEIDEVESKYEDGRSTYYERGSYNCTYEDYTMKF